jgi:hypothetical protein
MERARRRLAARKTRRPRASGRRELAIEGLQCVRGAPVGMGERSVR